MKIILTGASGFIGSHLFLQLESLLSFEVLGLCRSQLADESNSKLLALGDLDQADVSALLSGANVFIHAAARVHIMRELSTDPLSDFRAVNTKVTLHLARQAAKEGVKRFIFLSSIKVNGESTSRGAPLTAFNQRSPEDPAGKSKSEAEEQLLALGKETGMEIVIIRPPLVYGEGVKANFASLMKLVGKGFPLPFRAINQNKRSLVSVYNLVDLIKVCIDHPKAANQVFLVSDDDDMSTSRMVALMAKAQGKANLSLPVPVWCFKLAGKLFRKEAVVDRLVGSLQLDIEHTKNTLDWAPPYSVEHGFALAATKKN
ncbi:UDP-glucose 4-epimerase family protein [Marinomonas aquiplantarum]|uniref:Nucleoside-diphosphate-sugar epimerase n=1 Tax=Marinomonas aquiplantarum TaxID=491951 RepID=A0A366D6R2_9GAMM|nr:SDR family oxidoreductase [Marinomonas aquiplantarum]RBO85730.1 nucleoside-diphosphate-sugar epimerase [Marinomonas aquiplantarum]